MKECRPLAGTTMPEARRRAAMVSPSTSVPVVPVMPTLDASALTEDAEGLARLKAALAGPRKRSVKRICPVSEIPSARIVPAPQAGPERVRRRKAVPVPAL